MTISSVVPAYGIPYLDGKCVKCANRAGGCEYCNWTLSADKLPATTIERLAENLGLPPDELAEVSEKVAGLLDNDPVIRPSINAPIPLNALLALAEAGVSIPEDFQEK